MGPGAFGYFADQESGVVIVEATTERRIARSGIIPLAAMDTLIHDHLLYVAHRDEGVLVYELDENHPEAPTLITPSMPLASGASRLVRVELPNRGDETSPH
jgi:hypothetical protein